MTQPAEVWLRNPINYVREAGEERLHRFTFDYGKAKRLAFDPQGFFNFNLAPGTDWRCIYVSEGGSPEVDREHPLDRPKVIHPTFRVGFDDPREIEKTFYRMSSEGSLLYYIIADLTPSTNADLYWHLVELHDEMPEVRVMFRGGAYKFLFGQTWHAVDLNPRLPAGNGTVFLPCGPYFQYHLLDAKKWKKWIEVLGMTYEDLEVPRNRTIFNIRSAIWASHHYTGNFQFRTRRGIVPDLEERHLVPPNMHTAARRSLRGEVGDKFICDGCSLAPTCKSYREGAICNVSGTEASGLAKAFGSRDAEEVVRGLGQILGVQASRLEDALEHEKVVKEGLDPEVTKLFKAIFAAGSQLAKLLDPTLAGAKISLTQNNLSVGAGGTMPSEKEMTSRVIRALEAQGISREDITTEMVLNYFRTAKGEPAAIEATAREATAS